MNVLSEYIDSFDRNIFIVLENPSLKLLQSCYDLSINSQLSNVMQKLQIFTLFTTRFNLYISLGCST
jgi:hypothetical protein